MTKNTLTTHCLNTITTHTIITENTRLAVILAKDPTICSCVYYTYESHHRSRSIWGHGPCEGRAEMRGGAQREERRYVCVRETES
eukprot:5023978-Pyramimonas_sp.AAC.1